MNRQDAREQLKENLRNYVESITQESKGTNMYVCPLCGSGTGTHGTGAFSIKDETSWKCFACGKSGDIFDLIGEHERLPDYNDQLKRAGELFGITIDRCKNPAKEDFSPAPEYMTEAEVDYTSFFLQAAKDITKTSYHRGLSLQTLNHFKIGYVENWKHPKAPNAPASPRLIIPTSKYSYLARDTRAELTDVQRKYSKSKVGKVRIFNKSALWEAQKPVFIVEGELDALSIIDVGGEAVALGSTANKRALLTMLESQRPNQPLIIALDNDTAGQKASEEIMEGLKRLNIPFYRLNPCGEYKDANEALNADREAFRTAIEQAENIETVTLEAEREQLKKESALYALENFLKGIEESKRASFIPTGFNSLDDLLDGGLYAGLYIIGAISSLGKTTFCLQMADQIAQNGQDVIIFSLEMARNELIAKSVSRLTFVGDKAHAKTTRGILTGTRYEKYSQTERELIQTSIAAYRQYAENIYITEGVGDVGAEQIRNKVQKHIKLTGKAPVVLIDYLQIIAPADMRATDKQNTDKAVLELKRLSRDYSIPVIGISSFNRDNYTAPVNLASFKESGAIEYSSDVLIGLQYDGMDYQEGETTKDRDIRIRELIKETMAAAKNRQAQKIQVKILKNRNGSKGDVVLDFYPMFNYFTDNDQNGAIFAGMEGAWQPLSSEDDVDAMFN